MFTKGNCLAVGDAMIPAVSFEDAVRDKLSPYINQIFSGNWEDNWDKLQQRRLLVEKKGPEVESVIPLIRRHGQETSILVGLFVPVSRESYAYMPQLRILGVSRAGYENVNVEEATRRGIAVCNVVGRNAQAVSDFTIGLMLAECRNIARAHHAIANGQWKKEFANSDNIPELRGKTIGIIGFGHIGRLVARKLAGFQVNIIVYDPNMSAGDIREAGCQPVDKETVFQCSDILTLHARLTDENSRLVGEPELASMKPTSYLINTARAGLVDKEALLGALRAGHLAGAALDVFWEEPLDAAEELLQMSNVTLTSHLAGTTREALTRSPQLLVDNILSLIEAGESQSLINPEVLNDPELLQWLANIRRTHLQ